MSERVETGRTIGRSAWLYASRSRGLIGAALLLGGAVVGFAYRGYVDYLDIRDSNQRVVQYRSETRELRAQINDQNAKIEALQTRLTSIKAALDAIMPSKDTYSLNPNQSIIAADGRLTVGLVGVPSNKGIIVNVNGKQQLAMAGDVIDIAVDPSITCQVRVQSFDMFKAILTASCPAAAPR